MMDCGSKRGRPFDSVEEGGGLFYFLGFFSGNENEENILWA